MKGNQSQNDLESGCDGVEGESRESERERTGGRMLPEKSRELGVPVFNVL